MPAHDLLLQRFKDAYNAMGADSIPALDTVYHPDVEFVDPICHLHGVDALRDHLQQTYENVIACRFEFGPALAQESLAALPWTMHLRHSRLRRGRPIAVEGISHLKIENDLVRFHRDYFDAAQLLYENVPILGAGVRLIRRYAS